MSVVALKATCEHCGGSGARVTSAGEFARAELCPCQLHCARCEGTGRAYQERDGYRFLAPCGCQTVRVGVAHYNAAQLPGRCAEQSFTSLEHDGEFPHFESLRMIAEGICNTFVPGQTREGLLVSGPVGTGKTHLLAAILRYLTLEVRVPARYVEISFLYSEIRRGFGAGLSSLDIIAPLAEVQVLAIDELGKGKMSPFEQETVDELVSRRYNAGRPTFFATNYRLDEKPARREYVQSRERVEESRANQALRERVGERVWSRLQQMCRRFELPTDARDFRRRYAR